jgi:hypothetical protein
MVVADWQLLLDNLLISSAKFNSLSIILNAPLYIIEDLDFHPSSGLKKPDLAAWAANGGLGLYQAWRFAVHPLQ